MGGRAPLANVVWHAQRGSQCSVEILSENLEMPSADWWVDTPYGEQDCYNVMVRSDGDDWEPKEEFLAFVVSTVRKKSGVKMEHDDDMFIRVFKASPVKKVVRKVKKMITPKKKKNRA